MEPIIKEILIETGIHFNEEEIEDNFMVEREAFLDNEKYKKLKDRIPKLKELFSSSYLTALQENAELEQRWPLLNLVRQLLHMYNYKMEPIRKSNGYTKDGVKKFKRYFLISKI